MSTVLEQIKAAYDDGVAEINGNSYQFATFVHKERRKVFAFYTKVAPLVEANDLSFLDTPEFEAIEALILDKVLLDGSQLSKLPKWLDDYAADYVMLVMTAMGVISYPFMQGNRTA